MQAARKTLVALPRAPQQVVARRRLGFAPYKADAGREMRWMEWDNTEAGWQFSMYGVYIGSMVLAAVSYSAWPGYDIERWARQEALERMARREQGLEVQRGVYYAQQKRDEVVKQSAAHESLTSFYGTGGSAEAEE